MTEPTLDALTLALAPLAPSRRAGAGVSARALGGGRISIARADGVWGGYAQRGA
jgi:hypothetical protein